MKPLIRHLTRASALCALLAAAALPGRAADVGVSIAISQPGVYGRIDIGRFPQPAVVVAQPVIIGRPVVAAREPVYLWVPPGHQKKWSKHCAQYDACGVPVYFVQEQWYRDHVMRDAPPPRKGERGERGRGRDHDDGPGRGQGNGRGHGRD